MRNLSLISEQMQLDTSERVASIKQALAANSDEKAKGAVRKFIPTSQHVYGVRLPLLNQIAKEHREGGFELAEALLEVRGVRGKTISGETTRKLLQKRS